MKIRGNILWITRTAVFVALMVAAQFVTAALGNQFVTGSIGNLIMVISFLICGKSTGLAVAVISPICAAIVGVGPAFPPLVPFIALGNAVFILAWFLLGLLNRSEKTGMRYKVSNYLIAVVAAVLKFLTLYTTIVKFAIPYLLNLNEAQSVILTLSFSYPQIITAVIGGVIALSIVPRIQKALKLQTK